MAGLFTLSSISNPPALPGEPSDKLIHALLYAGLGVVTLRALANGEWRHVKLRSVLEALLIAVAYGVLDEFHQSFVPGRQSDMADVLADATGSAAAGIAIWLWGILVLVKRPEGIQSTEDRIQKTKTD